MTDFGENQSVDLGNFVDVGDMEEVKARGEEQLLNMRDSHGDSTKWKQRKE